MYQQGSVRILRGMTTTRLGARSDLSRAMAIVVSTERKAAGFTQVSFAQAAGLADVTLRRLEQGGAEFNLDQVDAIARALGVAPSALFRLAEQRVASGLPLAASRTRSRRPASTPR